MRNVCWVLTLTCCSLSWALGDDYTFQTEDSAPDGLPAALSDQVRAQGFKIVGPKRDLCSIWLLKDIASKDGFTPSLAIKYPFTPGQLIGVIDVPRRSGLTDFKGQETEKGLYTLRYGQQPMDGNHLGTSDTADFLLAVPIAVDSEPAAIADVKSLFSRSAEASGTTHPAIFWLLPAESESAEPGLTHDAEHDFWILDVTAAAGDAKVPLRVVVVGESKG